MSATAWSKFYWPDWRSDAGVRASSLAARGFWMEMLSVMASATPRGHLLIKGKPPTSAQLAAIAGCTPKVAAQLEAELEANDVFSRTADGVIYSRRMVKDARKSDAGREAADRQHGNKPSGSPTGLPSGSPIGSDDEYPEGYPMAPPQGLSGTHAGARERTGAHGPDTNLQPPTSRSSVTVSSSASAPLAEDWEPSPADMAGARKDRPDLDDEAIRLRTLAFKHHHAARPNGVSGNWPREWRKWIVQTRFVGEQQAAPARAKADWN